VSAALLLYSPACALAAYHSSVTISPASVTTPTRAFYQAPAVTDGPGLIAWCVMSLSEIVLLVMGAGPATSLRTSRRLFPQKKAIERVVRIAARGLAPNDNMISRFDGGVSGLVSLKELIEIRTTVDAAFWIRNANVSAPIPQKFNGLFDRRHSRVPFERQCPG
jgi:hypothetical protein